MSIRKRTWIVKSTGEKKTAWIVDYFDRNRKRHIETFDRKKDADARAAEVSNDIKVGTHVPRNASINVADAGANWIASGERKKRERGTLEQYRGHLRDYIEPHLGTLKLADLTGPMVVKFD